MPILLGSHSLRTNIQQECVWCPEDVSSVTWVYEHPCRHPTADRLRRPHACSVSKFPLTEKRGGSPSLLHSCAVALKIQIKFKTYQCWRSFTCSRLFNVGGKGGDRGRGSVSCLAPESWRICLPALTLFPWCLSSPSSLFPSPSPPHWW